MPILARIGGLFVCARRICVVTPVDLCAITPEAEPQPLTLSLSETDIVLCRCVRVEFAMYPQEDRAPPGESFDSGPWKNHGEQPSRSVSVHRVDYMQQLSLYSRAKGGIFHQVRSYCTVAGKSDREPKKISAKTKLVPSSRHSARPTHGHIYAGFDALLAQRAAA